VTPALPGRDFLSALSPDGVRLKGFHMPFPAIGAALSRALPMVTQALSKAPGLQAIGSMVGGGGGGEQAQGGQQAGPAGAAAAIIQRLKSMSPGGGD
jgi:hypothetical protein